MPCIWRRLSELELLHHHQQGGLHEADLRDRNHPPRGCDRRL